MTPHLDPIPIFVLTLEKAQSRRAALEAQLQALGLTYELFFGVDGTDGLPERYEQLVDRSARVGRTRVPMTDGEYACALSHLSIHRQIIERGLPEAVILEDDALIGPAFADLVNRRISVSGDLVMLDFDEGFFHWRGRQRVSAHLTAHSIAVAPVLATGYLMRQSAARYFVCEGLPVSGVADWPCDIRRLKSHALYPRIVGHPAPTQSVSHLNEQRGTLRSAHKAGRPKGYRRLFSAYFWRPRLTIWHRLRYRELDSEICLEVCDRK